MDARILRGLARRWSQRERGTAYYQAGGRVGSATTHAPTRQQQAPLRTALVGGHAGGDGVVIRRAQHGEHGGERGELHVLLDEALAQGQRQLPRRRAWARVRQVLGSMPPPVGGVT